jgi:CheY-like chemotaxis protein/pSer/pThr/pTyr-binding forkhead associated (FHA) protein
MPALRIKLPDAGETTHLLKGDRVTVGRAPDNLIQISHASISSHHAELVAVDGRYSLRDLQSTNRSYVEGKPVTACELRGPCTILFGSVECEFDPAAAPKIKRAVLSLPKTTAPANEAHLQDEYRELRERVQAMQRQFDLPTPPRLASKKQKPAEPGLPVRDRDELLQENELLKLQIEALQAELAMIIREREVQRQVVAHLELPIPKPAFDVEEMKALGERVRELASMAEAAMAAPADPALLSRIASQTASIADSVEMLGSHPFRRIVRGLRELLQDLGRSSAPPAAGTLHTVRQVADFLRLLLEPDHFAAGSNLPIGQVLVIDDDADLLSTVTDALMTAHLDVTGCLNAEDALDAVEAQRFDTILADVRLPGMSGPAFCARTRELAAYRRTPILFLTGADSVDARAEASLSGGNEFLAKPFNVYELALKVETWVLRQQLRLV